MNAALRASLAAGLFFLMACAPIAPERVGGPSDAPTSAPPSNVAAATAKTTPTQSPIFHVGDVVKMGDLEHKLWGARFSKGDQYIKPKDGERWLVLDIEVTNRGDKSTSVSSLLMWKLEDEEHRSADLAFATDTRGKLDGEIGVGRSIRGEIAFTVGAAQKQWELIFEPAVFGRGQAIYMVTATEAGG